MRGSLLLTLAPFLVTACVAAPLNAPPVVPDDASSALGPSVILLLTPTSTPESTLGAIVSPDTGEPSSTRRLVVPLAASTHGYLRYEGVRELTLSAGVASDLFGGTDAGASTHVAYDVSIEQTLYLAGEQPYDTRSRCCDPAGRLDPSCAEHVVRAFVGTGTFRYLARTGTATSGGFAGIEVHDGVSYQVERTRSFAGTLFAIEVGPSAPVCETAFCDLQASDGTCVRCRAVGAQSTVETANAPADDLLEVRCEGMPPGAPARTTLRGELVVDDCSYDGAATLSLGGATGEPLTGSDATSRIAFARTVDLTTTSDGRASVSLGLVDCRCHGAPARCRLDPELELAVETR